MKSFRLDSDSVAEFFDSWRALLAGALLACISIYLGITHLWGPVCALLIFGIYGGYLLRGVLAQQFREKYPGARWIGLLTVGFSTATIGVTTRMAFPDRIGPVFDLAWLGVSFFSILAFVIANRRNLHVV